MPILTTFADAAKGIAEMYKDSKEQEIVLLPLSQYKALVERLEDLKDLIEHQEEMKAYRRGEGRSFRAFLEENRAHFDV